ncbi:MAG TPA: PHP domain-containing protein [Chthoniobacterales bacterium]|nr:PHP domain-containing protein [Chthoniobacterales bacterium]
MKTGWTNIELAELLAREAERTDGIRQRALRRAARSSFLWPEHARDLLAEGRSLTELHGVGPFIEKQLRRWLEQPEKKVRPSPLRRDFLTLADARALLASHPAWTRALRGDLQMHTQWSDGAGTIAEMAAAGEERGYEYIAITDHSKGLKIAGGIDEVALEKQAEEIAATNESIGAAGGNLAVLRSIEMNLNPRGEGDMDPVALRALDLVLGAFHSALRKKEDQTERYLSAIRNPFVHIHAHPRGRVYNFRLGLTADWARIFAEAARLDKAVEIDSYPDRQDLNLALLRIAKREGVRISLGTDAHDARQLGFIELGLAAAWKAKIPAERIVNFLPLADLRKWAARRRHPARARKAI